MVGENYLTEISDIRTAETKLGNAISILDLLMKNKKQDPALHAVWWMLNEIKDQELYRVGNNLMIRSANYYKKTKGVTANEKEEGMSQFRCCPHCGACLDPSEICDCWKGEYFGEEKRTPVHSD